MKTKQIGEKLFVNFNYDSQSLMPFDAFLNFPLVSMFALIPPPTTKYSDFFSCHLNQKVKKIGPKSTERKFFHSSTMIIETIVSIGL